MKKIILFLLTFSSFSNTVIAQNFEWVKSISHPDNTKSISNIVNDTDGNSYILGKFTGTIDFDLSDDIYELTSPSFSSYLLKLDKDGNFLWVKNLNYYGGGHNIEIDKQNNLVIVGSFGNSIDFDPGSGVSILTAASGRTEIFILKLNSDGDFLWVKQTESIVVSAFTTDLQNNIIISGNFNYTKYFMHPSISLTANNNNSDMYILKLNPQGDYLWVKQYGNSYNTPFPSDLETDSDDNIIITGDDKSTDGSDIFLYKYDQGGNFLNGGTMGGNQNDKSYSIAIDYSDNVYITGTFEGTAMLGILGGGSQQFDSEGYVDAFILKYNFSNYKEWVIQLGASQHIYGYTIDTDEDGNIYNTGEFRSFLGINNSISLNTSSPTTYISKLDSLGNFIWASKIDNLPNRKAVTIYNNSLYLFGYFDGSVDFNPDENNSAILESTGYDDCFILKLNTSKLSTNVYDYQFDDNLEIANPNSGNIIIDLADENLTDIKIFDISGKEYFSENKIKDLLEFKLNKGIYILSEIKNSKIIHTRKILVK